MAAWRDIAAEQPELADRARRLLDAHTHKTIATLRRDGSPRISGIECRFADGELWFGSMPNAVKALDLRHDPRFALHSGSDDPPAWTGDAKVAGRAEEITDPGLRRAVLGAMGSPSTGSHLFRADLSEVVVTRLGDPADHLVIEFWREGRGLHRIERR